jgi:hypothetical protein
MPEECNLKVLIYVTWCKVHLDFLCACTFMSLILTQFAYNKRIITIQGQWQMCESYTGTRKIFFFHIFCLCVSCDSHKKHRIFYRSDLTHWFFNDDISCPVRVRKGILMLVTVIGVTVGCSTKPHFLRKKNMVTYVQTLLDLIYIHFWTSVIYTVLG